VKAIHKLPEEPDPERHFVRTLGWNLIAYCTMEEGLIGPLTFLRPPSVMSQKPIERWGIPPFPFNLGIFAVYPPDNLLTVAEEKEE